MLDEIDYFEHPMPYNFLGERNGELPLGKH